MTNDVNIVPQLLYRNSIYYDKSENKLILNKQLYLFLFTIIKNAYLFYKKTLQILYFTNNKYYLCIAFAAI